MTDPSQPTESTIPNQSTSQGHSIKQDPDAWFDNPQANADLTLTDGQQQLKVTKDPKNSNLAPGVPHEFTLVMENTGTGTVINPMMLDPIPAGLALNTEYGISESRPYSIEYDVPTGGPIPTQDDVAVELKTNGDRIESIGWNWGDWRMVPGAKVTIKIQMILDPPSTAGQTITNNVGVSANGYEGQSSPNPTLCDPGDADHSSTDFDGSDRLFCTDSANVTVTSGNAVAAVKWVAGNQELGFYDNSSGNYYSVDDPGPCLTKEIDGKKYTKNPCVALIYPGQQYDYWIDLRNAGTNPQTRSIISDGLPVLGDTGIIGTGPRGTQWTERPLLNGPVTFHGDDADSVTQWFYDNTTACKTVLTTGTPCAGFDTSPSSDTGSFAMEMNFSGRDGGGLQPGDSVGISFKMDSPTTSTQTTDQPIAWNSFAQASAFGGNLLLPAEPAKVGVAMLYGPLTVTKALEGNNPVGPNPDSFEGSYKCTVTNEGGGDDGIIEGKFDIVVGENNEVGPLPGKVVCKVWESDTKGAHNPHNSEATAIEITIEPSSGPEPGTPAQVHFDNSYSSGAVRIKKVLVGNNASAKKGPWKFDLKCTFEETSLPTRKVEVKRPSLYADVTGLPVGAVCTVTETSTSGLSKPPSVTPSKVTAAENPGSAQFVVTNTYQKNKPPKPPKPPTVTTPGGKVVIKWKKVKGAKYRLRITRCDSSRVLYSKTTSKTRVTISQRSLRSKGRSRGEVNMQCYRATLWVIKGKQKSKSSSTKFFIRRR